MLEIGGQLQGGRVYYRCARHPTFEIGGRAVSLPLGEVERAWDGSFIALWRPPAAVPEPIGPGARGKSVLWVRQRLDALDGNPRPSRSEVFDGELARRVQVFQREHQLTADGIIGEETLVRLVMQMRDESTPSLAGAR